jgi:hypothetical protein
MPPSTMPIPRGEPGSLPGLFDGVDPVLRELFAKLPPPGAVWPEGERALWLQAAATAIRLIYGPDETVSN